MVVSMRPIPKDQVELAASCTEPFPESHGAPIWIGDPADIGIENIETPDFGDSVYVQKDDVCCFWACGVSGASAVAHAKLPIAATHSPGYVDIDQKSKFSQKM